MRLSVLAVVVVAVALAGTAGSQTPSYVIIGDAKIGRFQTWEDGKLASAILAFGKPTSVTPGPATHYICVVKPPVTGIRAHQHGAQLPRGK